MVPRDARKVYKMRPIVEAVMDAGSWMEIGKAWGKSVITGLARLDGWPVAILASDPYHYGGAWTADACRKAVRMVDLAQTFQLPVVHLVDIPGFLIGKEAEASGVMRFGTQALAVVRNTTVPWCAIMVRKAFGMAGLTQRGGSPAFLRYAWPSAQWGSLPIAGGVEAVVAASRRRCRPGGVNCARRSSSGETRARCSARERFSRGGDHRSARTLWPCVRELVVREDGWWYLTL